MKKMDKGCKQIISLEDVQRANKHKMRNIIGLQGKGNQKHIEKPAYPLG
jgi:hypothetical protein